MSGARPAWHAKIVSTGAPGGGKRGRRSRDKKPKAALRGQLLEAFDERCAFCDHRFGGVQTNANGRTEITFIVWDHLIPWSYLMTSPDDNWLPACPICNGIKSDAMFKNLAEARAFVQARRIVKGWTARADVGEEGVA